MKGATDVKLIAASMLITACAGMAFSATTTPPPPSRRVHHTHRAVVSKDTRPIKRTWQTGPATMPPETVVIPPRPPSAPPRVAASRDLHVVAHPSVPPSLRPPQLARAVHLQARFVPVAAVQTAQMKTAQPEPATTADPEAQRVQDEFARLRNDAAARRAFYDDLLGTVERVRAGARDDNAVEEKPVSFQPASRPVDVPSVEPINPPQLPKENAPPPAVKPPSPQSSLGPFGAPADSAAYQRVVRWAKANDAPVALALGVAWMESRLNTNAPHGTSGEVGMFQIMPERCRLEGWPPERLNEPEFNAWMGTMLLARYYREEGSVARAAAKYVAGPGVFGKKYSDDMWAYINWYASTVESYASYFSRAQS